jgi:hypothetical protein
MLYLNAYDVVDKILKRLSKPSGEPLKGWCLLRFCGGDFDKDSSILDPQSFIGIVDGLKLLGFEFLGGYTDRGISKLVDVYSSVKGWLNGVSVSFTNLYWAFLCRDEPPSGLFVLTPKCLVFIPGVGRPDEFMLFRIVGTSRRKKKEIDEIALNHGLKWWGEPEHPILYRFCELSLGNAKSFWMDTLEFLEEANYSMI